MEHDGLVFHDIAELREVEGQDGLRLQRVPEEVRLQLDEGTNGVVLSPAGGEIRFRLEEGCEAATVRLSSESKTLVYAYHGEFQGATWELTTDVQEIVVKPNKRVASLSRDEVPESAYDPGLVRLCFGGAYPEPVFYHGHGDGIALPRPGDVPQQSYLAYGTSIAHGTDLGGPFLSYPAHTAWLLGLELRNLGTSGCCRCETAMADYLAEQKCSIVTLELSVNMLGGQFTADGFRERAGYLVRKVADADLSRPVVCLTLFPHFRDIHERYRPEADVSTPDEFRTVLREIVRDADRPNLSVIEGRELLTNVCGLTGDLIHPGLRGAIQIAENLARRLSSIVPAPPSAK
jgi:hypothetical protein